MKPLMKQGQRVVVHSFGDGRRNNGTVVGLALDHYHKIYIVRLDQPSVWEHAYECITVPEGCLQEIG